MKDQDTKNKKYDIEEYRKKKERRKWRNRLITVISVVLILTGIAVGTYVYQNYDISQLFQNRKDSSKSEEIAAHNNKFPISLSGMTPIGINRLNGDLVLLTSEESMLFHGGSLGHHFNHRFTNPVQKSSGGRILTYDRGGYGYRIDSATGLHINSRTTSTILTGIINDRHGYALVTKEARYAGSVTVFNKANEEVLKWYSANEQIVDVAFSRDDRYIAVACIGFSNGSISSKVYVIDLKKSADNEKSVFTFENAVPITLHFKNNGEIHVVTDSFVGVVEKDLKKQHNVSFSHQLYQYYFTNDCTYILSTDANKVSSSLLTMDGTNQKEVLLKGEVLDITDNDKDIFVLGKSMVFRYNRELTLLSETKVSNDAYQIEVSGNSIYTLGSQELSVYDAAPQKAEPQE